MKDYSKYLGCMFYRHDLNTDKTYTVRVVSFVNESTGRVMYEDGTTKKIKFEELEKDYVLVNPDGYIYFTIVELTGGIKDVIICFYRAEDIGNPNKLPYCVCRQNIYNVYSHIIHEDGTVGCCMSIDTIPDGVDYNAMRACNEVKMFTAVAIYNCDTPDRVLSCIKKINLYDEVIKTLHDSKIDMDRNSGVRMVGDPENYNYMGYCLSLKELLEYTGFWRDVRTGMGIISLDNSRFDLGVFIDGNPDDGTGRLAEYALNVVSKQLGVYVINERITKLTKFIDIATLANYDITGKLKTALLADDSGVYVLTYVEGNEYIEEAREIAVNTITPEEKLEMISGVTN